MAGFVNSSGNFNGNILSTKYVLPAVKATAIAIPGLTIPSDMEVRAEVATWKEYKGGGANDVTYAGQAAALTNGGFKRHDVPLAKAIQICTVLDGATMTANDDLSDPAALALMNEVERKVKSMNKTILTAVATGGTVVAAATDLEDSAKIEKYITNAIAEFETRNEATGESPKALIVSPKVYGALFNAAGSRIVFVDGKEGAWASGKIPYYAGLAILKSTDLPSGTLAVMCSENGFLAPYFTGEAQVINQVPGYINATLIQEETRFATAIVDKKRISVFNRA